MFYGMQFIKVTISIQHAIAATHQNVYEMFIIQKVEEVLPSIEWEEFDGVSTKSTGFG